MIITIGENVYPCEVKEILYHHSAVAEAADIGIPDKLRIERVHAILVLKEGQNITGDKIIDFCKRHLARYKAPKLVDIVESLPKTPQG